MFSTKTDNNWLHQVGEVCATTLELLEEKADSVGYVSHADETMKELCIGYLYLLGLCDSQGLLLEKELPDAVKKNITIH